METVLRELEFNQWVLRINLKDLGGFWIKNYLHTSPTLAFQPEERDKIENIVEKIDQSPHLKKLKRRVVGNKYPVLQIDVPIRQMGPRHYSLTQLKNHFVWAKLDEEENQNKDYKNKGQRLFDYLINDDEAQEAIKKTVDKRGYVLEIDDLKKMLFNSSKMKELPRYKRTIHQNTIEDVLSFLELGHPLRSRVKKDETIKVNIPSPLPNEFIKGHYVECAEMNIAPEGSIVEIVNEDLISILRYRKRVNKLVRSYENEIINYLTNTTFEIKKNKKGYEVIPHRISKSKKVDQTQDLDFTKMFNDFLGNFIQNLQGMLVGLLDLSQMVVFSIVSSIFQTMITLMVAAFIIIDYERILHFFRDLFPARFVDNIELFLQKQNVGLHGVVRGQLIICVVNGFLTWIGLLIFDIKFALTLSILATICSLIPIFGVIISSIPIVLMAITNSIYSGLFVLAWILGIHFIEGNILNPKIIGKSAEIHPVLVIFALMAGELTYGLFGALIAVPVFSILQTTFLFVRENVLSDIKAQ